jgi:lipoyl(octanoyl) transferase
VEHPHVYTLGKSGDLSNFFYLKTIGKKTTFKNRGGDITYHGPGQLWLSILDLENFFTDIP